MTDPLGRTTPTDCPCGSGGSYAACCGPLHSGEVPATTCEQLMRSRYAAFVVGVPGHLLRTWHPRTRPAELTLAGGPQWSGLRIVALEGGGADDESGTVEFVASYAGGRLHEVSRFERRAGRWVYVDGDVLP